jgi:hypothetical protein
VVSAELRPLASQLYNIGASVENGSTIVSNCSCAKGLSRTFLSTNAAAPSFSLFLSDYIRTLCGGQATTDGRKSSHKLVITRFPAAERYARPQTQNCFLPRCTPEKPFGGSGYLKAGKETKHGSRIDFMAARNSDSNSRGIVVIRLFPLGKPTLTRLF